jgi:hypothetical protein
MTQIRCSICQNERQAEIVEAYVLHQFLRKVAANYRIGYKSLERHLKQCVPLMFAGYEDKLFEDALDRAEEITRSYFSRRNNARRLDMRIPRPQPLGLKTDSKVTWGRKAWTKGKTDNRKPKAATDKKR